MAALALVQTGRLSLDEDVNLKLRSWKVPDNEFTKNQKVTLRRLLNHTAGFNVEDVGSYARGEALPTLVQTLDGTKPANDPEFFLLGQSEITVPMDRRIKGRSDGRPGPVGHILDVLFENALVHGRGPVAVTVRRAGSALEIDVGDEGPSNAAATDFDPCNFGASITFARGSAPAACPAVALAKADTPLRAPSRSGCRSSPVNGWPAGCGGRSRRTDRVRGLESTWRWLRPCGRSRPARHRARCGRPPDADLPKGLRFRMGGCRRLR